MQNAPSADMPIACRPQPSLRGLPALPRFEHLRTPVERGVLGRHRRSVVVARGTGGVKNRCYVKKFTYDVIFFTYDVTFFT